MATETTTPPEPTLLDATRKRLDALRGAAMRFASSWALMIFAGLVLAIIQLPYPLTIALLLLAYDDLQERRWQARQRGIEESVAWGMRRGNWQ